MRLIILFISALAATLAASADVRLQRATPESQGVPAEAVLHTISHILNFKDAEVHSVMVLRHGKVIGEVYPAPFGPQYAHTLYSCSKTYTAMAVGMAVSENRLRVTDRVAPYFLEELPPSITPQLADMTVEDLLTMRSGIKAQYTTLRGECSNWVQAFLGKTVNGVGEKFQYDSMDTYLLSAIIQKTTGQTLLRYLQARLFSPMGITSPQWELSPEGYNTGGWGLYVTPEVMAMTGQLLLDRGRWGARQLIDSTWVSQMMTVRANSNYGYQMWLGDDGESFFAKGALGQYIIVAPRQDMVVVVTQCFEGDDKKQRSAIYDTLLPSVSPVPLPVDEGANKKMRAALSKAALPIVKGKKASAHAKALDGKRYSLSSNRLGFKTMSFVFEGDSLSLLLTTDRDDAVHTLRFGAERWCTNAVGSRPPYSISAVGSQNGITGPFYSAGCYAWDGYMLCLKNHYVNWVSSLEWQINVPKEEVERLTVTIRENYQKKGVTIVASAL